MNRYAAAMLILLIVAGLVACGSADNDPAQRVEKPTHEEHRTAVTAERNWHFQPTGERNEQ